MKRLLAVTWKELLQIQRDATTMKMMGWLFDVHVQGSIAALYLMTGLYIAAVLGLGILISTIAQTQMQAGTWR